MKQVIRKGLSEIVVDEVPDPLPVPHHVVVQPACSLISNGTETASLHQEALLKEIADNPSHLQKVWKTVKAVGPVATLAEIRAKLRSDYAVVGYSGAGIVAARHETVRDLAIGERVAYCGEGTGHGERILAGRTLVARVPEGVDLEQACFAALGSIAMNAVRIASISLGDVVAVIGQGLVGQLVSQLARLQGAVVVALDLKPERAELAKRLGADYAIAGSAARESIAALTGGRGADCVIVAAAAKNDGPARQALEICRDRGRIVVVGAVALNLPWNEMYLKEIQLFMSRAYGPGSYDAGYESQGRDYPVSYVRWTENRNMEEFLRLVAAARIDVRPLITHRFRLEDAPRAYQTILDPASGSLAVVLKYSTVPQEGEPTAPRTRIYVTSAPKQSGKLGFALAGAGNLAKWSHLPNLLKIPGVSLRAVVSTSGARGKGYASRFGAAYCTSDYQQVLDDASVDAVVIASRNQEHATQAEAALRAGKHVFVEKPMALTEQECRALLAAAGESGRYLTVGFNRRFAPYYLEMKKLLAGRFGPAVVAARVNSPGISGGYWMADPSAGGAILGEACHFVDLFYWLLESDIVSVSAYSLPPSEKEPVGENNLAASFRFADGSVANLTYCTVGTRTSGGERVEAFAQGVAAITEDFKILTVAGAVRRTRSKWWADKGYLPQLQDFVTAIREGRSPQTTVLDGARATLACLRMLESARTLAAVPIDLASLSV